MQAALGMLINMLTARFLGPAGFGLIGYASSVAAFVLPIAQLGLNNIIVQEVLQEPEKEGKILGTSLWLGILSSLFCMAGVVTFAALANGGEKVTILVCALYSLCILFQTLEMTQYWFQAKFLSKYNAITCLVAYGVVSAYKIFLLATGKSVYWFALSNAIDYAIISLVLLLLYRRLGGAPLGFSWEIAKKLFSKSRHYIVSGLMVTIFAQTDKIMLKLMLGDAATGYYTAAMFCATMTSFAFCAIIDAARPSIFEQLSLGKEGFEKSVVRLYSVILYLSLAQSLFMTLLAHPLIGIFYGAEYAPAATLLQIVVWYSTFSYLGSVRNIWILACDLQKYLWIINLSGALANVVLNLALIPFLGAAGAALASLITQLFTNVVTGFIIKPIRPNNRLLFRALNPAYLLELIPKRRKNH